MLGIQDSNRVKKIEKHFNSNIDVLLYQLHWNQDMKHRDIAEFINIPRPTITRWFNRFNIPTQSCHRFTDKNLTSWLYKTGKLKKKPRYEGPDRRIQKTKGNVNIDFFKTWSPEMAYILGFFAADGGMFINPRGSKYIQFVSTDRDILVKIKKLMNSKHKIGTKKKYPGTLGRKRCYQIQIGSKEIYNDLLKLGFTPKKDLRIKFPKIPDNYLNHFVRGYFDGDGFVTCGWYRRKNRNNKRYFLCQAGFVCGNRTFLSDLSKKLNNSKIGLGKGSLRPKLRSWDLIYSTKDAIKLANYMYNESTLDKCLERKYNKFKEAYKILGDVA